MTSARTDSTAELTSAHDILERARTGTRLMTIRGALMRTISVGANLLLLVLVSPSELGLLAVARGTFALLQYLAELGIGKALLRRRQAPTSQEYAALAGLQLLTGVVIIGLGAIWSAPILGFGAIDDRWHFAMLGTVATMLSLAFGTGARVRLERALAYERLATVDVFNVLVLNGGLLIFAMLHQFAIGVFVLLGVATVAANALLYFWAPGPVPSLNLRPLAGITRESSGFLVASTCAVAREQGTPVLIGVLFGLPVAGLYSFAERVAQVLNITFDGFRNASVPAAARLAGDVQSLRALASRTLAGSSALTAPMAMMAIGGLPILAHFVPKWAGAVWLTQCYVVAYAVYGVLAASMEPAAVATIGARAAITEQASALVAGWLTFAVSTQFGAAWLPLGISLMYLAPILALYSILGADVRPELSRPVARTALAFVGSLLLYVVLRLLAVPLLLAAAAPAIVMLAVSPQWRRVPGRLLTFLSARRVNA